MKRFSVLSIGGLVCGLLAFVCLAETKEPVAETKEPASLGELLGSSFINAQGETVNAEALKGKTVIGLYFSAQWCPPCRKFTPLLVKAAEELKAEGKPFEVIFVSRDRNREAMLGYMKDYNMPWLALPFGDPKIQELVGRYKIRGIPALVIVDGDGKTITTQGRGAIGAKGAKAFDDWAPEK